MMVKKYVFLYLKTIKNNINQFFFFLFSFISFLRAPNPRESTAFLSKPMLIIFCAAANLSQLIDFVLIITSNSMLPSALLFSAISVFLQITNLLLLNCSNSCSTSDCSFFFLVCSFSCFACLSCHHMSSKDPFL